MGGGLSKHEDEAKLERASRVASETPADPDANNAKQQKSGCPMKRQDGSYSFDWGSIFRPSFPHGLGGKKPISESEARDKVSQGSSACPVQVRGNAPTSESCPVQHKEYNVQSVQFHPESILTPSGKKMLANWLGVPFDFSEQKA